MPAASIQSDSGSAGRGAPRGQPLGGIGRVGHGPNVPWRPVAARPSVAPMATRHETAHQPAFRPSERVQALFVLIGLVVLALIARAPGA